MISDVPLIVTSTTALWLGCAAIGLIGWIAPHRPPAPRRAEPEPIVATSINVLIADAPVMSSAGSSSAHRTAVANPPPTPVVNLSPPNAAAVPSIPLSATPDFVETVRVATSTTKSSQVGSTVAQPQIGQTGSGVAHLTFGVGEGAQPRPEYPIEAELARQEGTVVIRFTVGASGKVESAKVAHPCPFPLLNQSAVRTVRQQWRFPPGTRIDYEVTIQFSGKQS